MLVLYAIGRYLHGGERLIPFSEIDTKLKELLEEFGPVRRSYRPEYPFWRLQKDYIWQIPGVDTFDVNNAGDVSRRELLESNAHGGLHEEIYDLLKTEPDFVQDVVNELLEANFPQSIHEDVMQAVGIDLEMLHFRRARRDPYFRDRILKAYEYQCAVCGFNVRVGNSLVALEAAHIKWHQAGGPDNEENGIAMCSLHHKLFDRGAFTISPSMEVQVSDMAHGTVGFNEWLLEFRGKTLRPPQRTTYNPAHEYVTWHLHEVFKGYAR